MAVFGFWISVRNFIFHFKNERIGEKFFAVSSRGGSILFSHFDSIISFGAQLGSLTRQKKQYLGVNGGLENEKWNADSENLYWRDKEMFVYSPTSARVSNYKFEAYLKIF